MTDPARVDSVRRALSEDYPTVQYHFVQFLTEHLADCTRTFDGDLTQMVVLAVLGQATLDVHRISGAAPPRVSMGASRIADVTGLDRETVRRKLKALARVTGYARTRIGAGRSAMLPKAPRSGAI